MRIHSIYSVLCFPAAGLSAGVTPVSTNGLPIEVAGLHMLLNDHVFAKEFVPMVRPTLHVVQSTVTRKCACCVKG